MSGKQNMVRLNVEGMDCANCALGITKRLEKKGFGNVNVNFATKEASFAITKDLTINTAIKNIEDLGYHVVTEENHNHSHDNNIEKKFYLTLPFTIPLFAHMFLPFHFLHHPIFQLLLCLPVFIIGIIHFGRSAWKSLTSGVPNMDVLIAIGSTAAFAYSLAGTIMFYNTDEVNNYLFYETCATIITLVLLGNLLEHRSVKRTTSAIKDLTKLQSETAKQIISENGLEKIVTIESKNIKPGDVLLVNTGDKIPADGKIIFGSASINEAMISGESIPLEKSTGSYVIGATIVVDGSIKIQAEKVGNETVLSQIIELVKNAQQQKPTIQKLGDKISAIFVPVVLVISAITFLASYFIFDISLQKSIMSSVAVLVISCPCAMGLATPTAVMVGIGRAARSGILIKGGNTLEEFAKIKNIVFDKTGTLTTGDFKVKKVKTLNINEAEFKNILFSIEQHSSHPIAQSIVREFQTDASNQIEFTQVREEKGIGILATDKAGNDYAVGSYMLAQKYTNDNTHNIYVVKNDALFGWLDIEDEIKPGAAEMISSFKAVGVKTILLSGDSKEKTNDVANKLKIDEVYGEHTPSQKLLKIESLMKEGATAMVGDGINDAPSLAKANVGVSLGNATQVAVQTAQIVLLNGNDLSKINEAHQVSKHTLITIKQNLFWAFFYNVVAIPIAAIGLLSPMVGALSMAFSDIIVIGNSLRLKKKIIK